MADLFGNGIKVIGTTNHFLERFCGKMVGVAQLAERKNVALQVAGSSPVTHPTSSFSSFYPENFAVQAYMSGGSCELMKVWAETVRLYSYEDWNVYHAMIRSIIATSRIWVVSNYRGTHSRQFPIQFLYDMVDSYYV